MARIKAFLLFAFVLITTGCAHAQTCASWFDVTYTTDDAIYEAPNSMAGLLDAPAGKYGRPTITGGNFYLNGSPVRFWGTNWDFTYIIDNISLMKNKSIPYKFEGYNMVRSHGLDNNQWGYGIFESTRTTTRTLDDTPYSGSRIQMFDHGFKVLKDAGIYTQLTLYSSRTFLAGDSIANFSELVAVIKDATSSSAGYGWLSKAGQLLIFWNTDIQNLFYEYAYNMLTRTNPYTGIAYKDDPALAIVQMMNEPWLETYFWSRDCLNDATYEGYTYGGATWNRTTTVCTASLPASWYDPIKQSWNDWLEDKYSTIAAVKAAWGVDGTETFQPEVDDWSKAGFTFDIPNRYFCTQGKYSGGWNGTHCTDPVDWMRDTQDAFYTDAIIYFRNTIGWEGAIITEGGYYPTSLGPRTGDVGEIHAYLNHPSTVGRRYTSPLSSQLVMTDKREIEPSALTFCEEPIAYMLTNGVCDTDESPLDFLDDKPQMIGETLMVYPSTYAYEAPLRTAVRSLNAGYDSFMHFRNDGDTTNAGHGEGYYCTDAHCLSNFTFSYNLQQTALGQLAAWLFITHDPGDITVSPESAGVNATGVEIHTAIDYWAVMGDIGGNTYTNAGFSITPVNDGVVALFSKSHKPLDTANDLMLLIVGKIQQEGAYWVDSTHYDWGLDGSPQMYPVGVTITMPSDNHLVVTAVSPDGIEGAPLDVVYQDSGKTTFDICSEGNTVWYRLSNPGIEVGKANIKKGILR